jgi:hypothetical protein
MFITLKYPNHQELIPFACVVKFGVYSDKIVLTLLQEINPVLNFGTVTNKVFEITQESQPAAYLQIQEYLKSNSSQ